MKYILGAWSCAYFPVADLLWCLQALFLVFLADGLGLGRPSEMCLYSFLPSLGCKRQDDLMGLSLPY